MNDQELRDKLAINFAKENNYRFESTFEDHINSFKTGWDAARANENKIILKPETGGTYTVHGKITTTAEAERDQLRAEVERFKADYERACQTVAEMHAAAVGAIQGPKRGVVEDVADLKAQCEKLAEALENLGHNQIRENFDKAIEALEEYRKSQK